MPAVEPKKRRSRIHRSRTGKRIELAQRDIEIFRLLGRYRYLRSTYIHAFVGVNSGEAKRDLLACVFWLFKNVSAAELTAYLSTGQPYSLSFSFFFSSFFAPSEC